MKKEKQIIYCWNCGTKNQKENKKCKKCKVLLKQKEHPIIKWLFGETKEEVKSSIIGRITDLLSRFFRLHLYGASMGLALIFTGFAIANHYQATEKIEITEEQYRIQKEEKKDELEKEEASKETTTDEKIKEEKKPATQKEPSKTKKLVCESGYTLTNGSCIKKEQIQGTPVCPSRYMLREDVCMIHYAKISTGSYCVQSAAEYQSYYGSALQNYQGEFTAQKTVYNGRDMCDYSWCTKYENNSCVDRMGVTALMAENLSCPQGTSPLAGTNYCTDGTFKEPTYQCESGYEQNGKYCVKTSVKKPIEK